MVQSQVVTNATVYIQYETTNKSFIDMHYYLKRTGRIRNNFFLVLFDRGLAGVDPRDENLPNMLRMRVLQEIRVNYWYFIREVVRIPTGGGQVGGGTRYELHRGNLAMNFMFILNINMFVELPRQFGKTTAALVWYLWVYNFGSTNTALTFLHRDHPGAKDNLKKLKEIRDTLPSWLQMSSATGMNGKQLKVPNSIITMQHPLNGNSINTLASARSRNTADSVGRGKTTQIEYFDEFAFQLFNETIYSAIVPAFSTASANAKKNGSPYGILITTTPGDLTTEHGLYAYRVRNNATEFHEDWYDKSYEDIMHIITKNTRSSFVLISFSYQQLGRGMEYFNKMCTDLNNDWTKIRREVLLEWSRTSSNCPFQKEDLDVIENFCREPIREIPFGKYGEYRFKVYEDMDPRFPPIVGVDVAGAMYQDSSAITVIDSLTTRVTATLNCNYLPTDDLADILYVLASKYMPNCVINIERNGVANQRVSAHMATCAFPGVKTMKWVKNHTCYNVIQKMSVNAAKAERKVWMGIWFNESLVIGPKFLVTSPSIVTNHHQFGGGTSNDQPLTRECRTASEWQKKNTTPPQCGCTHDLRTSCNGGDLELTRIYRVAPVCKYNGFR